jgi:hypothetical protein
MEAINLTAREKLCMEIVEKIIPEAKKEAFKQFKSFPKQVKTEIQFSAVDESIVLTNLLTVENVKYEKSQNIKDLKKFKSDLLIFFIGSKQVYDNDMNFNEHGYDAQCRRIMEQFLALKKIEYLKKLRNQLSESHELPIGSKINWLGQPSQLGYLIKELIEKKYIENPGKGKSDKSLKKIARLIYNTFSIKDANGVGETSFDNFYKEIWGNSLSFAGKAWVKIKENTTQ